MLMRWRDVQAIPLKRQSGAALNSGSDRDLPACRGGAANAYIAPATSMAGGWPQRHDEHAISSAVAAASHGRRDRGQLATGTWIPSHASRGWLRPVLGSRLQHCAVANTALRMSRWGLQSNTQTPCRDAFGGCDSAWMFTIPALSPSSGHQGGPRNIGSRSHSAIGFVSHH